MHDFAFDMLTEPARVSGSMKIIPLLPSSPQLVIIVHLTKTYQNWTTLID